MRELRIHRELAVAQGEQDLECPLLVGGSLSVRYLAVHEADRAGPGGALERKHAGCADLFETAEQVLHAFGRDSSFEHRLCNHDSCK